MVTKCYIVEISIENDFMFEQLDNYHFNYSTFARCWCPGYMEIYIECPVSQIRYLENIMKWYV